MSDAPGAAGQRQIARDLVAQMRAAERALGSAGVTDSVRIHIRLVANRLEADLDWMDRVSAEVLAGASMSA